MTAEIILAACVIISTGAASVASSNAVKAAKELYQEKAAAQTLCMFGDAAAIEGADVIVITD